jgi:hypothetical protein
MMCSYFDVFGGSLAMFSTLYAQVKTCFTVPGGVLLYAAIGIRLWMRSRSTSTAGIGFSSYERKEALFLS